MGRALAHSVGMAHSDACESSVGRLRVCAQAARLPTIMGSFFGCLDGLAAMAALRALAAAPILCLRSSSWNSATTCAIRAVRMASFFFLVIARSRAGRESASRRNLSLKMLKHLDRVSDVGLALCTSSMRSSHSSIEFGEIEARRFSASRRRII